MPHVTYDPENGLAYIGLVPSRHGQAKTTVRLEELCEDPSDFVDVKALEHLTLDFDEEGRLIGIEVFNAEGVLRPETLPGFEANRRRSGAWRWWRR